MDLTQHLPQDDSWMEEYASRLGWTDLSRYYDRVFLRLLQMLPGEVLHVAQEVRPDNYDLFLKCACTAIRELHGMDIWSWRVDRLGTIIIRE